MRSAWSSRLSIASTDRSSWATSSFRWSGFRTRPAPPSRTRKTAVRRRATWLVHVRFGRYRWRFRAAFEGGRRCRRRSPTPCSTARRPGRRPAWTRSSRSPSVRLDADGVETAQVRAARSPLAPDPGRSDGGARDQRRGRRCPRRASPRSLASCSSCSTAPCSSRTTRASTWRCSSTRSRSRASTTAPPESRARSTRSGCSSRSLEIIACSRSASGAASLLVDAHEAPERRARNRGAPPRAPRRGHRTRDGGARPRGVPAAALSRRHAARLGARRSAGCSPGTSAGC